MKRFSQLAAPYVVWVALMIPAADAADPVLRIHRQRHGVVNFTFTLDHFIRFFTDHDFLLILWRSLGSPLDDGHLHPPGLSDRLLHRPQVPIACATSWCWSSTLPTWINMLVRTYAWIGILTQGGLLSNILGFFGLGETELLYTESAVLIGMVYNFIPFMILQINTSLCKMDHSLLEASADLGANKVQTFWRVTFPLSLSGVISGIALVFLPAVSSFFIPKLLGGGQFFLIGNVIENQFITVGEWNFGSAISMIMAAIMMLCMYLIRRVDEHNSGGRKKRA